VDTVSALNLLHMLASELLFDAMSCRILAAPRKRSAFKALVLLQRLRRESGRQGVATQDDLSDDRLEYRVVVKTWHDHHDQFEAWHDIWSTSR